MNPVKIFTDSTASLSGELTDKYNISVVPLYVVFGDESYMDGIEIDEEKLYKLVDEKGMIPTTSAATPVDFEKAFKPWVEDGYDIVYIGLSSKLSSTLQNAHIAAGAFEEGRVYAVDSLNLSSGIGLLVLEACECVQNGMDAKSIYEKITALVPRVRSSFVIDTLKHLYMGGRCSSLQKWITSTFRIHPRIIVSDGKMSVGEKFRGRRKNVLNSLLETARLRKDKIEPHRIFVTHSFCPEEEIAYLTKELRSMMPVEEIVVTTAGCVIATHCGRKTVGVLYIEKP